jgi:hypothetical protein
MHELLCILTVWLTYSPFLLTNGESREQRKTRWRHESYKSFSKKKKKIIGFEKDKSTRKISQTILTGLQNTFIV